MFIELESFKSYSKYGFSEKLLVEKKIDIIQVSDGVFDGIIGYIISKKNNIPFSFFLSSYFPLFKSEKFIKKAGKIYEKMLPLNQFIKEAIS